MDYILAAIHELKTVKTHPSRSTSFHESIIEKCTDKPFCCSCHTKRDRTRTPSTTDERSFFNRVERERCQPLLSSRNDLTRHQKTEEHPVQDGEKTTADRGQNLNPLINFSGAQK
ncbi:hypothetical protein HHI36_024328 [Cryptolaemus montrouzieri]|uniref:Uncharacterized protein n=1 Tax=Cryptolaemus montrouzieri TaxID=559131 RepID=A0ABD2NQ03_9CUCU